MAKYHKQKRPVATSIEVQQRKVEAKEERKPIERPDYSSAEDAFLRKIFMGIAALGLLAMLWMAMGSGMNGDEKFQYSYSQKLVNYYSTFGKDTSALNIPEANMHQYGGLFEVITGFTSKALGYGINDDGYHNVRHLTIAIMGWLAILCAALFARLIAGWRAGIITLILLLLSPRFIGHSLMNPKDIPFAAGYMLAIYNMAVVFRDVERARWVNVAGIAAGLGIALGLRAGGLLPFAMMFLFAGVDFLQKHGLGGLGNGKVVKRYAMVTIGAAIAGYTLAVLFWPYAMQSPLTAPLAALARFSEFEVNIRVLFEGNNNWSNESPWYYGLKWMLFTVPLAVIAGFVGSVALIKTLFKKYQPLWIFMVLFAAIFPVVYIIYKKSNLYDGWRHLNFVYPPIAILAGLFWHELSRRFSTQKAMQYATYGIMGLLVADAAWFIITNPKLPYVYFNPIAGGEKGVIGKYETDYWGVSMRQGVEWLEQQGILHEGMTEPVSIATNMFYQLERYTAKYGDKVILKYVKWDRRCDETFDYGLYPTRFIDGGLLQKGNWPPDNTFRTIKAGSLPILAIIKDDKKDCPAGIAAAKKGDWPTAIAALQKEVANVPDNDLAYGALANAYLNNNQLEEAKAAAEKCLALNPDDMQGNNLLGLYHLQKNDMNSAQRQFESAYKKEPANATALYYLAIIAQQRGDNNGALSYLDKCLKTAPNFKAAYELAARISETMGNAAQAQQLRAAAAQMK